jgi:CDP-glycerol glycerophosphotransferase
MSLFQRVLRAGYDFLSLPFFARLSDLWLGLIFEWLIFWNAFRLSLSRQPLVTIVIPVYNVERYIWLCLKSIRAQSHKNIRVYLVDDGSTDDSIRIARRFENQLNLEILRQENSGISAARNAGVAAIRATDYLMFLDSDDTLFPGAIKRLVRQAEATGSDFVIGDTVRTKGVVWVKRIDTREVFKSGSLKGVTFAQHPQVIRDLTAWNRLFRWSFYKEARIEFPLGQFFEDFAPMTKALIAAKRFDVLNHPVVHWRIRTEGDRSITQQSKDELKFEHRLAQLARVRGKIEAAIESGRATQENLVAFSERVLQHDLRLHPDKGSELRELAKID